MKIVKLISVFITLVFFSCSSKLSKIDYISRSNADSVAKLLLSDEVKNFNHVIFSVAENDFIIIVEKNNYYEEYFYNKKRDLLTVKKEKAVYNKPNNLFEKMFNKNIYSKDFITFNSKFFNPQYEVSSGNIVYFVLKGNRDCRYGEARLSFFIKPNPIDPEVYIYLTNQILKYNNSN